MCASIADAVARRSGSAAIVAGAFALPARLGALVPATVPTAEVANEALRMEASVARAFGNYPGRARITCTIVLRTGSRALDFPLAIDPARFTARRAGRMLSG